MLKPTVKRGLMLDFLSDKIDVQKHVNSARITKLNDFEIIDGDVVYLASRELRLEDNFAVLYGLELANKLKRKFRIVVILSNIAHSHKQLPFLKKGLNFFAKNSTLNNIDFEILEIVPENVGALIVDFNPVNLQNAYIKNGFAVFEVDSHNIIPARFISDKQEYSAATIRRKIYANINKFLMDIDNPFRIVSFDVVLKLNNFIGNKLNSYALLKNNPLEDVTSNMSSYLHFGFISSQRIALEILKSNSTRDNKEAYLEELIVRKELADNYCLYNKNFKSFDGIPSWAQNTLNAHKLDLRSYLYDINDFENAKTHDELWNKIQEGLLNTGRIHGYLRMFWAKKILEWSRSPEDAINIAVYLNDTYALDGNDSNGYVGILWSIGGLHDRPFTNRFVTGKIRYMRNKWNELSM